MIETMLCMASPDFQWQLRPFAYLLRKHWGRDIRILYYADSLSGALPEGVEYKQSPLSPWDWNKDFGNGFKAILKELDDPIVAMCVLDFWLVESANLTMIDGMVRYMEARPNVVHTALGAVVGVPGRPVETWEGMEVMTCTPHENFNGGIMMNCGLFNRARTIEMYQNTPILESEVMGWNVMKSRPDLMSVWVREAKDMYIVAHCTRRTARDVAFLAGVGSDDLSTIRAFLPGHLRVEA